MFYLTIASFSNDLPNKEQKQPWRWDDDGGAVEAVLPCHINGTLLSITACLIYGEDKSELKELKFVAENNSLP